MKYSAYGRSFVCRSENKPDILGSSDPGFHGDKKCWNLEEILVSSLAFLSHSIAFAFMR
jgi:hypothetical protein